MASGSDEQFAGWDDERYSTNIDRFDEQHKRLFGLLNDLYTAMDEGHSDEEVGDILRELEQYTEYHFGDEEEFMQDCGYAMDCADCFYDHREMHEEFAAKVTELREKHENGEYVTMEVLGFVRDWLDSHIASVNNDQNYADYFQTEVDDDYDYSPGALRQEREGTLASEPGASSSVSDDEVTVEDAIRSDSSLALPADSMVEWFESVVETHGDRTAALVSTDDWFTKRTFDDLAERARRVAAGLLETELEPGDRLGIAVESRYEWSVVDLACHLAGLVSVPVYPSFSAEQVQYVFETTEVSGVVTDGRRPESHFVGDGVRIDVTNLPTADPGRLPGTEADGDDVATIVFDVATASEPTGIVLTHRNLVAAAAMLEDELPLSPGSTGTCLLPLAHVYQRVATYYLWSTGSAVAYVDTENYTESIGSIQPEVLVGVPTVYQQLYGELQDRIGEMNWMKRKAAGRVTSYGRDVVDGSGTPLKYAASNRLVYKPLRKEFGLNNLEYAISAVGRLDSHLIYFFSGIGVPIRELYSPVEAAGVGALSDPSSSADTSVATPMSGTEFALSENGELLVRGPNVMARYLYERATKQRSEEDWYRTGFEGDVAPGQGVHMPE